MTCLHWDSLSRTCSPGRADHAETRNSGQVRRVAQVVAATCNGGAFAFNLFDLRTVDAAIGDDMLTCLDALRWSRCDLLRLMPNGEQRVRAVIESWGFHWPPGNE